MKTFASDNYSGVHPDVMEALIRANHEHQGSYGGDEFTSRATQLFKKHFGDSTEVFFVYNGTAANVLTRLGCDCGVVLSCRDSYTHAAAVG